MSVEYVFTISTSFSAGLATDALAAEIRASSISIALDYIASSGDSCSIWFKASLPTPDYDELVLLIAAHTGVALPLEAALVRLDAPREVDGRPIVTLTPGRDGWKTWLSSFGDDVALGPAGRGLGPPILVVFDGTETFPATKICTWQYDTPVEIHDGQVNWGEATFWSYPDAFSFSVLIPPTVGVATGTGNASLVVIGGAPLFLPAVPGTGTHAIDLGTAAPIPRANGGWESDAMTGEITPAPSGLGSFMLAPYGLEVIVIPGITMGNRAQRFDVDVYRTDWLHQTWTLKLSVKKTTPGAGWVSGWLFSFRPSNLRL
jgi:hypothetical protein